MNTQTYLKIHLWFHNNTIIVLIYDSQNVMKSADAISSLYSRRNPEIQEI